MTKKHIYLSCILFFSLSCYAQVETDSQLDQWDADLRESGFDTPDDVEALERMNTPDPNLKPMTPTFDQPNQPATPPPRNLERSNVYHPDTPSRNWDEHKEKLLESSNFDPPKPVSTEQSQKNSASNAQQKGIYGGYPKARKVKLNLAEKFNEHFPVNCIYGCTQDGQSMRIAEVVALYGGAGSSAGASWVTHAIDLNNPTRSKPNLPTSQWPSKYLGLINITDYQNEEAAAEKLNQLRLEHNASKVDSITVRWTENLGKDSFRKNIKQQPHMATALRSDQFIVTVRIGKQPKDEMPSTQFMQQHGVAIAELVATKMFKDLAYNYNTERERYETAPQASEVVNEYPIANSQEYLDSDIGLFYRGEKPTVYNSRRAPAGWAKHVSNDSGFSIAFPKNWKVTEMGSKSSFLKFSVKANRTDQKVTEAVIDVNRVRTPKTSDASKLDYVINQEKAVREDFNIKTRNPIILNGVIADSVQFEYNYQDRKRAEAIGLVLEHDGYLYYVRGMLIQAYADHWRRDLQRALQSFKVHGSN